MPLNPEATYNTVIPHDTLETGSETISSTRLILPSRWLQKIHNLFPPKGKRLVRWGVCFCEVSFSVLRFWYRGRSAGCCCVRKCPSILHSCFEVQNNNYVSGLSINVMRIETEKLMPELASIYFGLEYKAWHMSSQPLLMHDRGMSSISKTDATGRREYKIK